MTPTAQRILSIFAVAAMAAAVFGIDAWLTTRTAVAFPTPKHFEYTADGPEAGGGSLYGTGGPMHYGVQCAHCHIDGAGQISLDIAPSPAFQQSGNDALYAPSVRYDIVVTMLGEHHGLQRPDDNGNGIVFTFEDDAGGRMGFLESDHPGNNQSNCPTVEPMNLSSTTFLIGTCDGIISTLGTSRTQWQFTWTAPAAGSGPVTMWYGAVDGDWLAESSTDDDVIQGSLRLLEGS